ncbi:MAG TPA: nucleoside deaminase [Mycobacteriales bacterium]|nr:nucleoside deaminase [Mycobacteriales bacterium]
MSEALDPAWVRPLELAWESLRYGSFPVGAVVLDPAGTVVAEGRNRRAEEVAPARELAGTGLAHAEIYALAQLPYGFYPDHVVWSSLEPCLLCTSALRMLHIGQVRYAAADRYWTGVAELPDRVTGPIVRHWAQRSGPAPGLAATIGGVLPAWWYLDRQPLEQLRRLCIPESLIALARQLRDRAPDTFADLVRTTAQQL